MSIALRTDHTGSSRVPYHKEKENSQVKRIGVIAGIAVFGEIAGLYALLGIPGFTLLCKIKFLPKLLISGSVVLFFKVILDLSDLNKQCTKRLRSVAMALKVYRDHMQEVTASKEKMNQRLKEYNSELSNVNELAELVNEKLQKKWSGLLKDKGQKSNEDILAIRILQSKSKEVRDDGFALYYAKINDYPKLPEKLEGLTSTQIYEFIERRTLHHEETLQYFNLLMKKEWSSLRKFKKRLERLERENQV